MYVDSFSCSFFVSLKNEKEKCKNCSWFFFLFLLFLDIYWKWLSYFFGLSFDTRSGSRSMVKKLVLERTWSPSRRRTICSPSGTSLPESEGFVSLVIIMIMIMIIRIWIRIWIFFFFWESERESRSCEDTLVLNRLGWIAIERDSRLLSSTGKRSVSWKGSCSGSCLL